MAGRRPGTPHSKRSSSEVSLSDPRALRALAHPARLAIVEELYQGVEQTASELSELTGLSPSATSYHLRALERFGVVERAEAREDARERPWRASGRSLSLDWESPTSATDMIADTSLARLRNAFRRWTAEQAGESAVWRDVAGIRHSFLWLTEREAAAFAADLRTIFDKYIADRDAANHPASTRRVMTMLALVPDARKEAASNRKRSPRR